MTTSVLVLRLSSANESFLRVCQSLISEAGKKESGEAAYNLTFQAAAGLFRMPPIFHNILVFGHGEDLKVSDCYRNEGVR